MFLTPDEVLLIKKDKKLPKMKNNNYIQHMPYLRNSIAYDHDFRCSCLKWWCLQVLFLIVLKFFSKFCFSGLLGGQGEGGVMGKNVPKWQKILSHFVSQEMCLIWLWFFVHICKVMISPAIFFIFSKVWFFGFFKVHQWMVKGKS